jgi:hypothetical protein
MYKILSFDDLIINKNSKKEPYKKQDAAMKSSVGWGQRKLFFSELEFLIFHWNKEKIPNPTCLYVGAAEGTHIPFLSSMFPDIIFHLYDPRDFSFDGSKNLVIFKEFFTDETAKKYSGRNDIIFISDIRTIDYKKAFKDSLAKRGIIKFDFHENPIGDSLLIEQAREESSKLVEEIIWNDMLKQQEWTLLINQEEALLKFRLPYILDGKDIICDYLKGVVYWQIYQLPRSTETRLKPTRGPDGNYQISQWSCKEYEELCFYHNTQVREKITYMNPLTNQKEPIDAPELMNDYDTVVEAFLLKTYLDTINKNDDIVSNVLTLSKTLTWVLNKGDFTTPKKLSSMRNLKTNKGVGLYDPFVQKN